MDDITALAVSVLEVLGGRGETLATAESLTGGLLSGAVTAVPGSSEVYVGGLVTYATELKLTLLGVPAQVVAEHGVVSEECAAAMALGAAERTGADWALSTTGVAGPGPSEGVPAGTVVLGLWHPDGSGGSRRLELPGTRDEVRRATVAAALGWLQEVLLSANTGGHGRG